MSGRVVERLIRVGLLGSERWNRLGWREQSFFVRLLLSVDDYGRFEADADLLRAGLFARVTDRVSRGDVRAMLVRCHELGLVKLYTVNGRGYGRVMNFGQRLKFPRARYPAGVDEQGELGFSPEGGAADGARRASGAGDGVRVGARARDRRAALAVVEAELRELLRPGGAAYNVEPVGERRVRYDELMGRREGLLASLGEGGRVG